MNATSDPPRQIRLPGPRADTIRIKYGDGLSELCIYFGVLISEFGISAKAQALRYDDTVWTIERAADWDLWRQIGEQLLDLDVECPSEIMATDQSHVTVELDIGGRKVTRRFERLGRAWYKNSAELEAVLRPLDLLVRELRQEVEERIRKRLFTTSCRRLLKFLAPFLIGTVVVGAILWRLFR